MRTVKPLAAIVASILASMTFNPAAIAVENAQDLQVQTHTKSGKPSFILGKFGVVAKDDSVKALKQILSSTSAYAANGNEDFVVTQQWTDQLGQRHTRVDQTIDGLKVYGTSMIIHSNERAQRTDLSGKSVSQTPGIYGISGALASSNEPISRLNMLRDNKAVINQIANKAKVFGEIVSAPELAYIYLPLLDETKLAFQVTVSWNNGGDDFGKDVLFFDAKNHDVLTRNPLIHSAKSYQTHSLENREKEYAPGVILCVGNQRCGDVSAQRAHDGASNVYDYYKAKFGRNGIDNYDMPMISSVHLGQNVANAYWNGSQMLYGDGDGRQLGDLTLSYEVIGHELTHGVVQYTANLPYRNAQGALNEAFADIFGVAAKAYRNGTTRVDWQLAKETYTPAIAGDAMRYMNNPTQDKYSKDWYPERIPFSNNPNDYNDHGGVHGNSGIANLAFVLAVDGGQHPRGKSSANVPALGLAKAEQIFYRALTTYVNQSTDFFGARAATARAAEDLYGATDKKAIETAWCAVGVGECPAGNSLNPIKLQARNVSVQAEKWYRLNSVLPKGYRQLVISTSGGQGDVDLYIRHGIQSTAQNWDCRPYLNGNNETCTVNNPKAGKWHIDLYGYRAASGVTVTFEAKP